jgi:hypothetical protein
MLSQMIWWVSMALEILLLARGLWAGLLRRYPVFYSYILFVLLQDFVRLFAHTRTQRTYEITYWVTEFLGIAMGCFVVLEIYRVALAAYPGTARMARNVLFFLFLVALGAAAANTWKDSEWLVKATALQFELSLRTVQGVSVIALVILFLFYSIPFGTNLRGILLAYSFFIGGRIVVLTFLPPQGHHFWFYAYSASYPVVLGLWLAHLWTFEAYPVPKASIQLEEDYQRIVATTRRRLQEARGSLRKAVDS